jgi:hypothetical protein
MKLTVVEEFCKEAKIPKEVQSKWRRALKYNSQKTALSVQEKNELLAKIPSQLRYQV